MIASTAGRFCELASCDAWSIAWIIIVVMSEPPAAGVALLVVAGVDVAGVAGAAAFVSRDFASEPMDFAVAAASTLAVSEMVSRSGELALRTVAGATIVIERVGGVCVAGVPVVAGAVLAGVELSASSLCFSITWEKLCD